MILSNDELWTKCAEWGSYVRSGDPGSCMYGFSGDSSFQDRDHANTVIDYVNNHCMKIASNEEDMDDLFSIVQTAIDYLGRHPISS